jgi:hypothetical protein
MVSWIFWFFQSDQAPTAPDPYVGFAERIIPDSYGGFCQAGEEVERLLDLPRRGVPDGDRIYLFIGWDFRRKFGLSFSTRTSSGKKPWHIDYSTPFNSRGEAVRALAKSLRLLAKERMEEDPDFKDLLNLRKK